MAAFLNRPSDFATKSSSNQEPLILLPPSAFEKPQSCPIPCLPPARVQPKEENTDEIEALQLENQKLREKLQELVKSNAASNVLHHTNERHYADELIMRQAEELSKLRTHAQHLENEKQSMRQDYECRLSQLEREKEETVSALSDSLSRREEYYERQIAEKTKEHQIEVQELKSRLEHISSDLEQRNVQLTSNLSEIKEELRVTKHSMKKNEEDFLQQIREKDTVVQTQTEQIQQLKTYITETEQQHRPQHVWQHQCQMLSNKLKILEAEKESMQSSIQLLEVRLSSLREILNTQEQELSKGENLNKNKQKELLLSRWRQKVYALLVQQKSGELANAKDAQNWQEKTKLLDDKLTSAHNTINILQHTVNEREAEIKLAANSNKALQEEFQQAQQVALSLETQLHQDGEAVGRLSAAAAKSEEQLQQRMLVLQQAMSQLKILSQRISFASSRMDVLKSQMSRREALRQLEGDEAEKVGPRVEEGSDDEESWRQEKEHLQQELGRVRGERDMLAAQLHHDSQAWADKVSSLRSQYDQEVGHLKRTVEDLELVNQEKSQLLENMHEELDSTKQELAEVMEQADRLGTELARQHSIMEQELEKQKKNMEAELTEHLASVERKLNEAQREHTKAVITMRQQERQWGRERGQLEQVQQTTEAHYRAQLQQLESQLQEADREKNIFMATLRQEGLLGKLRLARGEAVRFALQDQEEKSAMDTPPQHAHCVAEIVDKDLLLATDRAAPEAVQAVLEDLKALLPSVLEDSAESSDDSVE